jgi:hypothetical protein
MERRSKLPRFEDIIIILTNQLKARKVNINQIEEKGVLILIKDIKPNVEAIVSEYDVR